MPPPLAGPWTDQGSQTDLLPQGHGIMQLSACFTDRYHVQSSKLPAFKCPFLSKWAVTAVKGKQCLLQHHTLFGLLFHIKDKKMGHRLCLATNILQMPVLVLWTVLLSQEPDSDIHTWIGTIWWWPLPPTSAPSPRCFMLLFQPNCSKLYKFQMQHFYIHNHSLIIYFTVKALVWQMKIE